MNAFYIQVGEVVEIRVILNFKGKSKGYAYVQFKSEVRKIWCAIFQGFFRLVH
jgi:RNA recognition motif-containing protein